MTSYFRYDPESLEDSTYSIFKAKKEQRTIDPASLLCDTGTEGLELFPASVALATLDRQAGGLEGMGLVLQQALATLKDRFDYILMDCPPMLGVLMVNALAACEHLIIPVQTEFLALKGLERMLHTLDMILRARAEPLNYTIVPTMFDRRTNASIDSLQMLQETYEESLWNEVIPVDTNFREASRAGVPASICFPNTHGVIAYTKLLRFLQQAEGSGEQREVSI
jgi:chromosome partitioning protein